MLNDPTVCWPCVVALHAECLDGELLENGMLQCCCAGTNNPGFAVNGEGEHFSERSGGKSLGQITDIKSTGRKRAAQIAPIFDGMLCEWSGLKFAGGGVIPIIGCAGNTIAEGKSLAEAKAKGADQIGRLHHGSNKSTLDNRPGINLHRICETCHQRFHALNNKYYSKERPESSQEWYPDVPYFLHDPDTQATEQEIEESEKWWRRPAEKRGPYPFELPPLSLQRKPQRQLLDDDSSGDEAEV